MDFMEVIQEFETATIINCWKGGGDPEDISAIKAEYRRAKTALVDLILKLKEAQHE